MPPSTKKKKAAIKRRKKRASANIQPSSSPTTYQQQQQQEHDEEEDDDEKETTNGSSDINIETSTNQQLVETEKEKDSSFTGDNNNKPNSEGSVNSAVTLRKNSAKESQEEMAGDKEIGDSGKVHIEFPKKSGKEGSSSSSSSDSSSDDESNVVNKIRSSKKKVLEEFKHGMAGIGNAFSGILPSEKSIEKKKVIEEFKEGMAGIGNAFSGILPSEKSIEKIVSSVEEKLEGSSSTATPSKEVVEKILPESVPPSVDTSNAGVDNSKVPETPDSPEKEALLPIVPTTLQPAWWKNCCGLFEVLTGSNR